MTHIPTGITVNMQDEKSQIQNRAAALRVLKSRLLAMKHEQEAAEAAAAKAGENNAAAEEARKAAETAQAAAEAAQAKAEEAQKKAEEAKTGAEAARKAAEENNAAAAADSSTLLGYFSGVVTSALPEVYAVLGSTYSSDSTAPSLELIGDSTVTSAFTAELSLIHI